MTIPDSKPARWRAAFRALQNRNFRLFFFGQGVSMIGTWMQQIATTWLVFEQTGSPFWLGVVGFAGQVPTFFLSPVAGALSDRWDRHRTVVITQTLAMLQAFALAVLVLTGRFAVGPVILLGAFLGCVNAFDIVTRQAFLTDLLADRDTLGNAIALNSTLVNGARLVGPSLAGFLIAWTGAGVCFLFNGLSYLAVLAALLAMTGVPRRRAVAGARLGRDLRDGFAYAFGFAPIRAILLLLGLVSLVGGPYTVLMPVIATDPDGLNGGPQTYGLLMAAVGLGALGGAAYLAARTTVLGLGTRVAVGAAAFGVGLVAFSFARGLWLALPLLFLTGFAFMTQAASSNTVLQTIVEDDKRGRVMSFYSMAFMGMFPLGSLLAGALSDRVGAPVTLRLGGILALLGAAAFASQLPRIRAEVRPIYRRLGILPPLASQAEQVLPADESAGAAAAPEEATS